MSADRIHRLHEEASERYLSGDYKAAIVAWKELLQLDPANEHALEGVRMARNLDGDDPFAEAADAAGARAVSAVADRALEDEIDDGLAVLGAAPAAKWAPEPAGRHPERQGEGIDFGESESIAAIPLAREAPSVQESGAHQTTHGAVSWEAGAAEPDLLDLEEADSSSPSNDADSVAEEALRHRVVDLLEEARECRDRGEVDAALGVISRIYILDESNAAAHALENELRDPNEGELREAEGWVVEGVQAFDLGRLDEAAELFNRVLEQIPGHREAIQYLDTIAARAVARGQAPDDLLGDADLLGDIPLNDPTPAVRAPSASAARGADFGHAEAPELTPPEMSGVDFGEQAPTRPRRPLAKWVIAAAIAVVVVAIGVMLVAKWWGGRAGSEKTVDLGTPPKPAPRAKPPRNAKNPAPAPPANNDPSPDAALKRARTAMERADYGAAVLAFNEALAVRPSDPEALAGLQQAGELYRAWKSQQGEIDGIKASFRAGEFTSALRVLYRLPDSYDRATIDRWKVHGWFNLGVVALRAGEIPQAVTHFDEALSILPDAEISKWRTFAQRYRNRPKDRPFYAAAEAIPFRTLD